MVCCCAALLVFGAQGLGLLDGAERRSFDQRMQLFRSHTRLPDDIVLILIDEASLSAMASLVGRWPWPREVHADVIDFLVVSEVRAVVFDVLFTESSIGSMASAGACDQRLVQSTKDGGMVMHACQLVQDSAFWVRDHRWQNIHDAPALQGLSIQGDHPALNGRAYNMGYWPYESLCRASQGVGVTSFRPDEDGVYRRAELLFRYHKRWLPSLALTPLTHLDKGVTLHVDPRKIAIKTDCFGTTIPLDCQGRLLVNLYGSYSAYSYAGVYLSALRLKTGELHHFPVQPFEFKDKIVFIGASAAGVEDLKTSSLGHQTPGVLLHASAYGNMITGDYLQNLAGYLNALIILLSIIATACAIFISKKLKIQVLAAGGVLIALTGLNLLLFSLNRVAALVPILSAVLCTYTLGFTWIGFSAGRDKRKIKNVLGQYVSPAVLATVLSDHKQDFIAAEVGRRETLSLLFCDIRDFTAISEKYAVEQVVAMLNRYLETMVDVIFKHQGTLDKFIGDAIMAFWGAPVRDTDHAFQAVSSALGMQQALAAFNQVNQSLDLPLLRIGMGIHTDEVILGNIGSQKKLDYTVIGDGVNLTSRLESLTKYYQCPVLITQQTYTGVQDRICCRLVDYVKVKGKQDCTFIYKPVAHVENAGAADQEICALAQKGFELYRQRRFRESSVCYGKISDIRPHDALSQIFMNRCNEYSRIAPGEDWQGASVFETK